MKLLEYCPIVYKLERISEISILCVRECYCVYFVQISKINIPLWYRNKVENISYINKLVLFFLLNDLKNSLENTEISCGLIIDLRMWMLAATLAITDSLKLETELIEAK